MGREGGREEGRKGGKEDLLAGTERRRKRRRTAQVLFSIVAKTYTKINRPTRAT